jgi:chorismate synthase
MLRFLTAGESHGPCLTAILDGMPAGVPIDFERLQKDLARRQHGYGRGGRMQIEQDQAKILSGVRHGVTLGSPITLQLENKDWSNWKQEMSAYPIEGFSTRKAISRPRPGHADLAGACKFNHLDVRNVLERASARETAARVAVGVIAKCLLKCFSIQIVSHTVRIGQVQVNESVLEDAVLEDIKKADTSPLRCIDPIAEKEMIAAIDHALEQGDTLGGIFEVIAYGLPVGLGSYTHWDSKLDGRLAQAIMSIQAVKAIELGNGIRGAFLAGSQVQDEICYASESGSYARATNRAGGLEGGVTNGMPLRIRGFMKPISTLRSPLMSVEIKSHNPSKAAYERSDICVVPAGGVIGEAMMALILGSALLDKFGGDSLGEIQNNYRNYLDQISSL